MTASVPMAPGAVPAGHLLEVEELSCEFQNGPDVARVLQRVSLTLDKGITLGIVGESGSGKSMFMKSILGIAPRTARVTGTVRFDGVDLGTLSERERRRLLGRRVGIVFQNPMTSLNPVVRVGRQIEEANRFHFGTSGKAARALAIDLLAAVGLPDPDECYSQYPHQFSGGMKQRIMIATALACQPDLLIADEATTALDVTVQKNILDLLQTIQQERRMSMILVTHNLGIVAGRTDEVAVMYGGRIVEHGPTETLFRDPRHRYTEALLSAIPRTDQPAHTRLRVIPGRPPETLRPIPGCPFAVRCTSAEPRCWEIDAAPGGRGGRAAHLRLLRPGGIADGRVGQRRCVRRRDGRCRDGRPHPGRVRGGPLMAPLPADEVPGTGREPGEGYLRDDALLRVRDLRVAFRRGRRTLEAVAGVSLDVARGETLGLVGESGCGKTTTGRAILRLLPRENSTMSGSIVFDGTDLGPISNTAMRAVRRRLQMIFQDPLSSFNPRRKVWDIVGEGLTIQGVARKEIAERVDAALVDVGMSRSMVEGRRPHQFSGGQCQRLAIARALALDPDLIVCDEPVASLDVSVQAHVINLLQDIRERRRLALVFISHDLAVVRNVSDRVAVMYMGKIVEIGEADRVYARPAHPYTRTLLEAVPIPDASVRLKPEAVGREMPSPSSPPSGCRFRTRCPRAQEVCAQVEPPLLQVPQGQHAACHFPHDEPAPGTPSPGRG